MVVAVTVAFGLSALGARAAFAETFGYSNPISFQYAEGQTAPRKEVRDPCIIHVGDTYYLVFTMWPFRNYEPNRLDLPDQGGSPGIALYSSKDLKGWKFENWLVKSSELPENCPYKDRFWAPEIHSIKGKFYLIFTADNWIKDEYNPAGKAGPAGYAFVGVADKVTGPYEHITYIAGGACDMTLAVDEKGETYGIMPHYNISVRPIDLSRIDEGIVKLTGKDTEAVARQNDGIEQSDSPKYLEGPWVEHIGDRYYLFYAANYGKEGYWTDVAYASNPMGPWKKDPRGKLLEGGHLAVFDGPGGKWFSYRGESRNSAAGLLCIDPVNFDTNGKVVVGPPTLGQQTVELKKTSAPIPR